MPGMAPIAEPIHEQRRIKNQFSQQSLMPAIMPLLVSSTMPSWTTAARPMARSQSSGSAKMPSVSGTSGKPSHRYSVSMVQRSVPDCGSVPIMRSIMPKQANVSPRSGALPDSTATMEIPNTAMPSNSGEPIKRMIGRMIGSATAIKAAPNSPPIKAAIYEAPSARPASPRRVIG